MRALLARFPRLAESLPRAGLPLRETPVEEWQVGSATLLIKRDDLDAPLLGGNKARALELLLANADPRRAVLTVGATGSTHALAVASHGRALGLRTEVITWPQETHAVADATAARMRELSHLTAARSVVGALLRAAWRRAVHRAHWIPAGGSTPLGALGHVDAGLELAQQLAREGRAMPDRIVLPLGSGGTTAGLLLGLAIAGARTQVVGVRVVPRLVANRGHVLRLARRTRALLASLSGESLPPLDTTRLVIEHRAYGGAYGRETADARHAAALLRAAGGPPLDGTYSAKAFGVALARAQHAPDERVLFWLTFDGRWLAAPSDPTTSPGTR
ncbi:MAG TPA: pyridoxal-phosphate dependent enzyme [Gemmatimonadaceae bacterium]|nr:pyridoxal-phosphate dependent enzyme [Gemmatimonadaceae bacterium]